jgi:hypothetical protein
MTASLCTWIHSCQEPARYRVWFESCRLAGHCTGHLVCRIHASGKQTGIIRSDKLDLGAASWD